MSPRRGAEEQYDMAESKLGDKHECISCGAKFYDLGKPRHICPKCGTDQKKTRNDKGD